MEWTDWSAIGGPFYEKSTHGPKLLGIAGTTSTVGAFSSQLAAGQPTFPVARNQCRRRVITEKSAFFPDRLDAALARLF